MTTFMFSSQGELGTSGFRIAYEQLYDLAREYVTLAGYIYHGDVSGGTYFYGPSAHEEYYESFKRTLAPYAAPLDFSFVYINRAATDLARAWNKSVDISQALFAIYEATVEAERRVKGSEHNPYPASTDNSTLPSGFAAGFYAAAAEAEKQRQQYEEKKGELDGKYGSWLAKVKKGDPDLYVKITEDLTDEERAEFEAYLQEYYPEEWQRYQEMMAAQKEAKEYEDWLEDVKEHDPILYAEIMQKLAEEEQAAWEKDMQENHPEDWQRHQEIVAEQQRLQDEEDARRAYEEWLERVREESPELYDKLMEKQAAADHAAWEEDLRKNHPEEWQLYQEIKAEEERLRKEAEEAAKALEEQLGAQDDFGLSSSLGSSSDLGGSSWSSDSGFGGSSGLDLGGSDWSSDLGGYGGSSDYGGGGSFGSVDDWGSDLLADTVNAEELGDAGNALSDIAGASTGASPNVGFDALGDNVALEGEDAGFWGTYGSKIASLAHAYGLQAAALAGGAVALYATREQTTEAVALAAEFVSTRCKPFAADVVDQVRGAAKQTHVDLAHARGRAVDYSREEGSGDLLG